MTSYRAIWYRKHKQQSCQPTPAYEKITVFNANMKQLEALGELFNYTIKEVEQDEVAQHICRWFSHLGPEERYRICLVRWMKYTLMAMKTHDTNLMGRDSLRIASWIARALGTLLDIPDVKDLLLVIDAWIFRMYSSNYDAKGLLR